MEKLEALEILAEAYGLRYAQVYLEKSEGGEQILAEGIYGGRRRCWQWSEAGYWCK